MALLVESTNTLNRAPQALSVAARTTTSLPSSSKESNNGSEPRPTLEEGASSSPQNAEDILSLSQQAGLTATQQAGEGAAPVRTEEVAAFAGNTAAGEQVEETTGPGTQIKSNLESAKTKEAERLEAIQEELSQKLNSSLSLRFKEDSDTGIDFFQLIEPDSGDVVRQIPAEEVIEFIKKFQNSVSGLFLSEQA